MLSLLSALKLGKTNSQLFPLFAKRCSKEESNFLRAWDWKFCGTREGNIQLLSELDMCHVHALDILLTRMSECVASIKELGGHPSDYCISGIQGFEITEDVSTPALYTHSMQMYIDSGVVYATVTYSMDTTCDELENCIFGLTYNLLDGSVVGRGTYMFNFVNYSISQSKVSKGFSGFVARLSECMTDEDIRLAISDLIEHKPLEYEGNENIYALLSTVFESVYLCKLNDSYDILARIKNLWDTPDENQKRGVLLAVETNYLLIYDIMHYNVKVTKVVSPLGVAVVVIVRDTHTDSVLYKAVLSVKQYNTIDTIYDRYFRSTYGVRSAGVGSREWLDSVRRKNWYKLLVEESDLNSKSSILTVLETQSSALEFIESLLCKFDQMFYYEDSIDSLIFEDICNELYQNIEKDDSVWTVYRFEEGESSFHVRYNCSLLDVALNLHIHVKLLSEDNTSDSKVEISVSCGQAEIVTIAEYLIKSDLNEEV